MPVSKKIVGFFFVKWNNVLTTHLVMLNCYNDEPEIKYYIELNWCDLRNQNKGIIQQSEE